MFEVVMVAVHAEPPIIMRYDGAGGVSIEKRKRDYGMRGGMRENSTSPDRVRMFYGPRGSGPTPSWASIFPVIGKGRNDNSRVHLIVTRELV